MAFNTKERIDRIAKIREEFAEAGITPLLIYHDKKKFIAYKKGIVSIGNSSNDLEMCVLDILERLGFPMEEMGTYIFKNMVIKIAKYLDELEEIDGNDLFISLKKQVLQPYSQFYLDLARNELDMGITTYHYYLIDMIKRIDFKKADDKLLRVVLGKGKSDLSYGELAIAIGSYLSGCLKNGISHDCPTINVGLISDSPKFSLKFKEQI